MPASTPGSEPGRRNGQSAGRHDNPAHSANSDPSATLFKFGAHARLFINEMMAPFGHALAIARDPADASADRLQRPGDLATVLTFERGLSWPDRRGLALIAATLDGDGLVLLAFSSLADALACQRRLRAGAA